MNVHRELSFTLQECIKNLGEGYVQEDLLEGHICIARELTNFLSAEKKFELGCDPNGQSTSLIRVTV